jgi:hypothetical protein
MKAMIDQLTTSDAERELFNQASGGKYTTTRAKLEKRICKATLSGKLSFRSLRKILQPLFQNWGEERVMLMFLKAKWHDGKLAGVPNCGLQWFLKEYRGKLALRLNSKKEDPEEDPIPDDYEFDILVSLHALKPEWHEVLLPLYNRAMFVENNELLRNGLPKILQETKVNGNKIDELKADGVAMAKQQESWAKKQEASVVEGFKNLRSDLKQHALDRKADGSQNGDLEKECARLAAENKAEKARGDKYKMMARGSISPDVKPNQETSGEAGGLFSPGGEPNPVMLGESFGKGKVLYFPRRVYMHLLFD